MLGSTKNSETILVVDDELVVGTLLSEVLRLSGYYVLVAKDGEHALRLSREHTGGIDLLLTDVRMPGMNGLDLAGALSHERPEMRVIIMSGYAVETATLDATWYVVRKPFIPSHLRTTIAHLLAGKPSPPHMLV